MLILPLIENAFKHGIMGDSNNSFVNISVLQSKDSLAVTVSNNKGIAPRSETIGGIGLKNIRQRLQMIYPGRAALEVTETAEMFNVSLRIESL